MSLAAPPGADRELGAGLQRAQRGLEAVPLAARGPVSEALGRDDRAYHVRRSAGALRLANRGQRLAASFGAAGVRVRSGGARLGLGLRALGYGEALPPVGRALPRAHANRVAYRRGALTQWYVNGPFGLEQGFTLRSRPAPARSGPLTLALALSGNLFPALERGRRGVRLRGAGDPLRYTVLAAADARGRDVSPARDAVRRLVRRRRRSQARTRRRSRARGLQAVRLRRLAEFPLESWVGRAPDAPAPGGWGLTH